MFYRKNTQVRQSVIFVLQEIVSGKHVIKKKVETTRKPNETSNQSSKQM